MTITVGEIGELTGLEKSIPDAIKDKKVTSLLTDSRSLLNPEGTLFFAIPTRTNAGENFMRELYDKGVRMFVAPGVPENMKECGDALILINENPIDVLQKVASRRGRKIGGEVIGITGSKGKTTLKEWLFQLLEPMHEIARSPRSYNSQIGVPLSMWEISDATDLTLIEAGISQKGEMERLEACIQPDTVVITDMSHEHDDGFASYSEKVAEKALLARNAQTIIYCEDEEEVKAAVGELPAGKKLISWSEKNPDASLYIANISNASATSKGPEDNEITEIEYEWHSDVTIKDRIRVSAYRVGDVRNAIYALAVMLHEGYAPGVIARRFSSLHPIDTRISVSDGAGGCSILYDSYTSDLTSLLPAVDFMARRRMPGQRSVVILSDLRHEGASVEEDYCRIAELMKRRSVDLFIGVGPKFEKHSSYFGENSLFFPDSSSLAAYLRRSPLMKSIVLLKGSEEFDFRRLKEILEVRTHETVLEVNLDAMLRNYRYFKSHLPASTGMIAMVKASGYGAGSYEISKTLQDAGASYLAVAVLDEGIDLRRQGITMPIMVMNPRVADYAEMFENHLEPEIYTPGMLDDVIEAARNAGVKDYPIHIKLDTGMHRMGFIESELPQLMQTIKGQDNVRISSVFTHLATADEPTMNDYTEFQLEEYRRCSDYILSHSSYPIKRHILNSAGILRYGDNHHYDMARLGIGLYGVNTLPAEMEDELSVVSSLKTVIINIREWESGTTIGYGRRGRLDRHSRVATIPIGYADGMNRKFGNGAIKVLVNGKEAPTIGNICMDACMIDVTGIDCSIGDEVEIFGENMPVSRLSDVIGTIPYEILTSVSPRVKRIYFRE